MTHWQYTDQSLLVVVSDDGRQSCLASVLPEGTPIAEPDPPPIEARKAALEQAVQAHLDAACATRRWDNIRTAALRAGYPGPYQAEAIAWAQWMDACWVRALSVMNDVLARKMAEPTAAELVAMLPAAPVFNEKAE